MAHCIVVLRACVASLGDRDSQIDRHTLVKRIRHENPGVDIAIDVIILRLRILR